MKVEVPSALRVMERLVRALYDERSIKPERIVLASEPAGIHAGTGFIDGLPEDPIQRARQRRYHLLGMRSTMARSPVVLWRGDMLDAAVSGAQSFYNLPGDMSIAPAESELWLLDEHGPACAAWRELGRSAREVLQAYSQTATPPPGLQLSAMLLESWSQEHWDRAMAGADEERREMMRHLMEEAGWREDSHLRQSLAVTFLMDLPGHKGEMPWVLTMTTTAERLWSGNAYLFAALEFLRQEFVGRERVPLGKWKPGAPQMPHHSLIRRVVLRRRSPCAPHQVDGRHLPGDKSEETGESGRTYNAQWMVAAHWRRLPKPRKSDGKLVTYVRPYVKGNPDAPLLPRFDISHVKR